MKSVKSEILNEEMGLRSQGTLFISSLSEVLSITFRGRSKSKGSKGKDRSKRRSNRYANIQCHHNHRKGPNKRFCRKFKEKNEKEDDTNNYDRASMATNSFLVLLEENVINLT